MGAIPAGLELRAATRPCHALAGPLYEKRDDARYAIALVLAENHENRRGAAHGGVICTLTDFATSRAASLAAGALHKVVAVIRPVDFPGNGGTGDRIEPRLGAMRPGKRAAFAECFVERGSGRMTRASGTIQVLRGDE